MQVGVYTAINGLLGPANNDIAVYCGNSIRWSFYEPDPSTPDCFADFDPFVSPRVCAAKAPTSANSNSGGFLYAPYPGVPKTQKYYQIKSSTDTLPSERTRKEGNAVCANEENLSGVTYNPSQGNRIVQLFCPITFNPSSKFVNDNTNAKYWTTIPSLNPPQIARIAAHLGSTTGVMIHELGHAARVGKSALDPSLSWYMNMRNKLIGYLGVDVVLNGQRAYEWTGVVDLGKANNKQAASANTAYRNCDTIQAFALGTSSYVSFFERRHLTDRDCKSFFANSHNVAMYMSLNDWSSGKAKKP